jgi:hypothetical protein
MYRKILLCFAAGNVGALAASLVTWLAGAYGINAALGVALAPGLSLHWLYPRLVWGGLWGLLFLVAWRDSRPLVKGLMLSLFPSALQLLYWYPFQLHQGFLGLELGVLTPLLILFFNAIWGLVTAISLKLA